VISSSLALKMTLSSSGCIKVAVPIAGTNIFLGLRKADESYAM